MRILAVDHGEKRIGLALSDATATIASPLKVIEHVSRAIDAAQVADLAAQNNVALIVGVADVARGAGWARNREFGCEAGGRQNRTDAHLKSKVAIIAHRAGFRPY